MEKMLTSLTNLSLLWLAWSRKSVTRGPTRIGPFGLFQHGAW